MATPEKKIYGIPMRAVPDWTLPIGARSCVSCALYDKPDCSIKTQTDAGFENCVEGAHHYEAVQ